MVRYPETCQILPSPSTFVLSARSGVSHNEAAVSKLLLFRSNTLCMRDTGWANAGDTSACTSSSTEPCPFVSELSTTPGWRWSVGRNGASGDKLNGYIDEVFFLTNALQSTCPADFPCAGQFIVFETRQVRVHSQWIDLGDSSLWRP